MLVSVTASLLVPVWIRGPGELKVPAAHRVNQAHAASRPPRVRIILVDGASRGFILPARSRPASCRISAS